MSGRKLGGGRILGSGRGLGPAAAPRAPRSSSTFSPSESTASIASSSLSPPASTGLPDFSQDIGASISVGSQAPVNPADAAAIVCPICNEEMVTLLQLNRHIDDNHQELDVQEQDEVKTWFDKQVFKAKRFQPFSLLNQKIRGLEVFESNEIQAAPAPMMAGKLPETPIDPDELITRHHWQRSTAHDFCTDPTCGKGLGPFNGSINCRKCGKLFCEVHTMYQMKLSRSANHEPVHGSWARVCETCYKSRDGYNDHAGVSVDHTDLIVKARRKKVERHKLEVSRLEKRLTKLTKLLANPPEKLATSNESLLSFASLTGQKDARKLIEQSIVTWENDEAVSNCPFCHQEFGSWTFRRHHCRICGRVVCADNETGCSSEVSLNIAAATDSTTTEKPVVNTGPGGQLIADIRMCRECNHTIFSSRDFAASMAHKPLDQRAYETLCQFQRGIEQLMPSFHRALLALQPEVSENGEVDLSKPPPSHAQIESARKIRKRLMDSFSKYMAAANRIRDMPTNSEMQKRLQMGIYTFASSFLHTNMLPLKNLPNLLRSRKKPSSSRFLQQPNNHHRHQHHHSSSSGLRHTELAASSETASQTSRDGGGNAPSEASTIVSQLETEERDVRERLAVLEEQRFMVDAMVKTAKEARRFEEVTALTGNVDELDGEIRELKKKIGSVEARWDGVYRNGA